MLFKIIARRPAVYSSGRRMHYPLYKLNSSSFITCANLSKVTKPLSDKERQTDGVMVPVYMNNHLVRGTAKHNNNPSPTSTAFSLKRYPSFVHWPVSLLEPAQTCACLAFQIGSRVGLCSKLRLCSLRGFEKVLWAVPACAVKD